MPSTIFTSLVKDIKQLHAEKEKNWFKLKYNSRETSRQEITKAFSLSLTAHPRHGNTTRQHTLLCLEKKSSFAAKEITELLTFFFFGNFIYILYTSYNTV